MTIHHEPLAGDASEDPASDAGPRPDAFGLVRLDAICDDYLGLSFEVARRRHAMGTLPVRAFRLSDGRRGPLFVHVDDVQRLIARRRTRAVPAYQGRRGERS